jgi:hypothetical protein
VHKVNNYKGSIYMVCDYMDHDLTGLMERRNYKFTLPQVPNALPGCPDIRHLPFQRVLRCSAVHRERAALASHHACCRFICRSSAT